MRFGGVALGAWISLMGTTSAGAQTIALSQICPVRGKLPTFDPTSLMMSALDAAQPSRRAMDADGDGTETESERLDIVMLNPCVTDARCKSDVGKIVGVQQQLAGVFERADVVITRKRGPATADELRSEPWLGVKPDSNAVGSISELVDPRQRFLSVTCKVFEQTPDGETTGGNPPPTPPRKVALRVTGKLEELSRTGEALKDVDPATLSIENDSIAKKLTFDIDAFVGIDIPVGGGNTLIPFVQYQRTSVRDRSTFPATTKRRPDKLGVGAIVGLRLAPHDQVDLAPIYVVDYEKGSRVGSLKANWIPGFLRQIDGLAVQGSYPLIPKLLSFGLTPRVLAQGSHVFDPGTNTELRMTSDYLRAGGDVTVDLWGNGALSDFTGSVAYKRLFRLTSGPRDIDLLKASVQYWLDDDQHVSIGYIYERGLDEDTADRVNDWKLTLGVRF